VIIEWLLPALISDVATVFKIKPYPQFVLSFAVCFCLDQGELVWVMFNPLQLWAFGDSWQLISVSGRGPHFKILKAVPFHLFP